MRIQPCIYDSELIPKMMPWVHSPIGVGKPPGRRHPVGLTRCEKSYLDAVRQVTARLGSTEYIGRDENPCAILNVIILRPVSCSQGGVCLGLLKEGIWRINLALRLVDLEEVGWR